MYSFSGVSKEMASGRSEVVELTGLNALNRIFTTGLTRMRSWDGGVRPVVLQFFFYFNFNFVCGVILNFLGGGRSRRLENWRLKNWRMGRR